MHFVGCLPRYTFGALLRPEREWLRIPYENEYPGTYLSLPLFDLEAWYSEWYMNDYGETSRNDKHPSSRNFSNIPKYVQ